MSPYASWSSMKWPSVRSVPIRMTSALWTATTGAPGAAVMLAPATVGPGAPVPAAAAGRGGGGRKDGVGWVVGIAPARSVRAHAGGEPLFRKELHPTLRTRARGADVEAVVALALVERRQRPPGDSVALGGGQVDGQQERGGSVGVQEEVQDRATACDRHGGAKQRARAGRRGRRFTRVRRRWAHRSVSAGPRDCRAGVTTGRRCLAARLRRLCRNGGFCGCRRRRQRR